MPYRSPRRWAFVVCTLWCSTAALSAYTVTAQTTANWSAAVDGQWTDATKWSTNPLYPNNGTPTAASRYDVVFGASGTPYRVTASTNLTVDSLALNSADAELEVSANKLIVREGVEFQGGKIILRNSGSTSGRLVLLGDSGITGSGTIDILAGDLYFGGTNPHPIIGPDVVIRGGSTSIDVESGTVGTVHLTNYGTIEATGSGPGIPNYTYFFEIGDQYGSSLNFVNLGVLAASNGHGISARLSHVGQLEIGPGGTIAITSTNSIVDQAVNIPETGKLVLAKGWSNTAPISVNHGTLAVKLPGAVGAVNFDGGTLLIQETFTPAQLAPFNTSPGSTIQFEQASLNLDSAIWDYTSLVGKLNFVSGAIYNGTVTGPAGVHSLASEGHRVAIQAASLDLQLQVPHGIVALQGAGANLQPIVVNGGRLEVSPTWNNQSTITVNSGRLVVEPNSPVLNNTSMTGGTLALTGTTTLADLSSLPVPLGSPQSVALARYSSAIDLQSQTLDLAALPAQLELEQGTLTNGTIIDSSGNRPLQVRTGFLSNVSLTADVEFLSSGQSLRFESTTQLNGIRFYGAQGNVEFGYNASVQATAVTFDVPFRLNSTNLSVREKLTVNATGRLDDYGQITFRGNQSLSGSGEIFFRGDGNSGQVSIYQGNLTIDEGFTIRHRGSQYRAGVISSSTHGIINRGTIIAERNGWGNSLDFLIDVETFANSGTLYADRAEITLTTANWINDGIVRLNQGAFEHSGTSFTNGPTGKIEGSGTLKLTGVQFTNQGTVAPGLSAGILQLTGNFAQHSLGNLTIELGGTDNSNLALPQFDQLVVSGTASLDGSLQVSLLPGFTPQASDTFTILTAGSLVGLFTNANGVLNTGFGTFDVSYTNNSVVLSNFQAAALLPGDYNGDFLVDAADYTVWRDSLGQSVTLPNDLTPGLVSLLDYDVWKSNFGAATGGGGTASVSAPECASATLLMLGVLLGSASCPRRTI